MTILAFKSSPGVNVISFEVKSNSDALFHIDVSVTGGLQVILESSALTDKMVSVEELRAMLLGISLACALDSRLCYHHCTCMCVYIQCHARAQSTDYYA